MTASYARIMLFIPASFEPIFYDSRGYLEMFTVRQLDRSTLSLEATASEREARAWLAWEGKYRMRLIINVRGLSLALSPHAVIRPSERGVLVRFGAEPDPGSPPRVTPLLVKRYKMRKSRRLDRGLVLYLNRTPITEAVERRGYTVLHYVGGLFWRFSRGKHEFRAPYVDLRWGSKGLYFTVTRHLFETLGLSSYTVSCLDYIRAFDGSDYIRMVPPAECRGETR